MTAAMRTPLYAFALAQAWHPQLQQPVTAMRTTLMTLALAHAWQPQLPQTGNWTQLIEEELDRSLRVYERPANATS